MQAPDGRGSKVSPRGFLQNELIQGQVRDGLAQPLFLLLEPFEFLRLVGSHPAIFLAPAVAGLFGNANFMDCIHPLDPLTDKHINLP